MAQYLNLTPEDFEGIAYKLGYLKVHDVSFAPNNFIFKISAVLLEKKIRLVPVVDYSFGQYSVTSRTSYSARKSVNYRQEMKKLSPVPNCLIQCPSFPIYFYFFTDNLFCPFQSSFNRRVYGMFCRGKINILGY